MAAPTPTAPPATVPTSMVALVSRRAVTSMSSPAVMTAPLAIDAVTPSGSAPPLIAPVMSPDEGASLSRRVAAPWLAELTWLALVLGSPLPSSP